MDRQQAILLITDVCKSVNATYDQHQQIQEALALLIKGGEGKNE